MEKELTVLARAKEKQEKGLSLTPHELIVLAFSGVIAEDTNG